MRKVVIVLAAVVSLTLAGLAPAFAGNRGGSSSGGVEAGAETGGSGGGSGGGGQQGGSSGGGAAGGVVGSDGCTSANYTDEECAAAFAPEAPAPAPGVVAERAFDSRKLPAPKIKMSPGAPNPAIVGLKTWLWVEGGAWGDQKAEAEAGDAKVTTTASPVSIVWDMGEKKVVCNGPGRAWRKGLGKSADTDCGYTYRRVSKGLPGGTYKVRVYLTYSVSWKCKGDDCDDETEGDLGTVASPAATANVRVVEKQAVVVR